MRSNERNYIKRLKRRNEDALEFVIDRYAGLVKGCVQKVIGPLGQEGAIEECINDVFLAIWEHADQFEGNTDQFKGWVYRIAKYRAIDHYRKLVKRQEVALEQQDRKVELSSEQEVLLKEEQEALLGVLQMLEPIDQKIFVMKYCLDTKSEEIGKKLGMSQSAVDNRIYRGKKKLSNRFEGLDWRMV
ncbi:MAG: sigma-70 family RNA polymerase sigma factor [Cellulosilyticaceae bacterium]